MKARKRNSGLPSSDNDEPVSLLGQSTVEAAGFRGGNSRSFKMNPTYSFAYSEVQMGITLASKVSGICVQ